MSAQNFSITPIPAFNDNYLWLIYQPGGLAVIVDPGDAKPVFDFLDEKHLTLSAILVTHRHWDHINGIEDLRESFDIPVYGPDSADIPQITHALHEGDQLKLLDNQLSLKVMAVPGHTREHIAYFGDIDGQPSLFCGDTLFAGGCGRLFDGTHEQLRQSLERLKQLPGDTKVYCTHEYTLSNLTFAQLVEPDNAQLRARVDSEYRMRELNQPTLPTTIELERVTNPFLRYQEPSIRQSINQYWNESWTTPQDLFAGLRRWKDEF
ncbi:MAG: hydroxyacylglutathione hydrolase [Cellvibrionaceae bacterium]|jgi:hydroxyacylglutathione hydrolase